MLLMSPSAMKVWIEIDDEAEVHFYVKVTFREEGVDWNGATKSLFCNLLLVTFREEGVDWNIE